VVQLAASGVCHTDLSVRDGLMPALLPCTLGHEGAGIVTELGADVTPFAPATTSCSPGTSRADPAPTVCAAIRS
jgi:Zn-dependent alcohol dehydrogenase